MTAATKPASCGTCIDNAWKTLKLNYSRCKLAALAVGGEAQSVRKDSGKK
jgi:hypothetical protein